MKYGNQRTANLLGFFTDPDMQEKREVLQKLIDATPKMNWALSCSCSLYFRGIADEFHDYDIIVEQNSLKEFKEKFSKCGGVLREGQQNGKENYFDSQYFAVGEIGDVDFDIISNFTVTTYKCRYTYALKQEHIEFVKGIPLCPVETAFILYGMMIDWQERRRMKYDMSYEYLDKNGVNYPDILKEAYPYVPKFIGERIDLLLK